MNAFDLPRPAMTRVRHGFGRRAMDIIAASVGIIVLSPLMLTIALVLLLEGGRPVLFVQPRIGAGGRLFHMYKFRKFDPRCDSGGLALTLANDLRMTAVGRILALTKFDELPQLWNVLKGEMAIVGPRPESLAFAECFRDGYEAVLQYKPGLLGPAQIMFRREALFYPHGIEPTLFYKEVLFPAKARIDLSYYGRRTMASDAALVIRGVFVLLGLGLSRSMEP
ncbi:sugar transferase [Mesorhizobium sp.]|uniref:sugar transferase n=1 Tax=Mesorhizobium sp. TaxID=1871066 RepID=UPI000FE9F4A8|nr:sugar transferase [Mesorhizobium sp.]RWM07756.1 MAG: sugar transferase [Mesorhizobium sp.]RWM39503.1 MAG: sugar transferase [Mesorhizobium sp.]TIO52790.1 MAG: sugar transferase [Mesorhizobium sp.]TIO59504.1 MAG: sugar transferase [Mesorhizobium sp.]TJV52556.1 MAG: sugar transferase [Mesorhizobium sp.]